MIITIITFVLVLSVLVFAHELGHFMMARRFGVKAEEFGFGFPPRIWGIYQDQAGRWRQVWGAKEVKDSPKTVYSINLIPLGGFVKIKGENGDDPGQADSFVSKKIWQRAIMLAAGVLMNIILAAVLIMAGYMIGLPQEIDQIDPRAIITNQEMQVVHVFKESPAAKAGISAGDVIVKVDGNEYQSIASLQNYVEKKVGQELTYDIKQGENIIQKTIAPAVMEETGKGGIGIAIRQIGLVRYPWYLAVWQGAKTTVTFTWEIIKAFFDLIKNIFAGRGVSADLAGPVGIAVITGQVARLGIIYLLQFIALLSINLAVINFLPVPALDGGRILFLAIEKIKGSPVKRETENVIHNIGFALLMILVLVVTFRDVSRFSGALSMIWEKIF